MMQRYVIILSFVFFSCGGDDVGGSDAAMDASAELSDELSMPATPTMELESFNSAQFCGGCHAQHFAEWKTSNHAYAMVDPVYRKLVEKRQQAFDGKQDKFCLQCHSAIGTRSGDIQAGFNFDELADITLEGITCESCHKVSGLARNFNSGHIIDADGPIRGPIQNPMSTPAHESEFSELHDDSAFCGGCHDIVEVSGLQLERPYQEWLESPSKEAGDNCQSCHMPTYEGSAAPGAPSRELHSHRWIGVDVPFLEGFLESGEEEIIRNGVTSLLEGAASLLLEADPPDASGMANIYVHVKNEIPAHNFPTGSTFIRQSWVELTVRDGNDNIVYQTGHLDEQKDLRNFFSASDPFGDPDLILLSSGFTGVDASPVIYSWDATEHHSGSLSPGYTRTYSLFVPVAAGVIGPLSVDAKIRFRAFAPYLLRELDLENYVEALEVYDVADAALSIPLSP